MGEDALSREAPYLEGVTAWVDCDCPWGEGDLSCHKVEGFGEEVSGRQEGGAWAGSLGHQEGACEVVVSEPQDACGGPGVMEVVAGDHAVRSESHHL